MTDKKEKSIHGFRVYGDNLAECHKFCEILAAHGNQLSLEYDGKEGPKDLPVYLFQHESVDIGVLPCGRYKDWAKNRQPPVSQEDSDIILCHTTSKNEVGEPILEIEFNDAINAGNQDWQRFPRIAQAAERDIPYIYTVNVASAEVTDGKICSFRHPNSTIQFAQLALMANYGSLSLTVYSDNPWYGQAIEDGAVSKETAAENWEQRVAEIAISAIYDSLSEKLENPLKNQVAENARTAYRTAFQDAMSRMLIAMREYVSSDLTVLKNHPVIQDNPQEVADAWVEAILDGADLPDRYKFFDWSFSDFAANPQPFKKTLSTKSIFKDELNPKLKIKSSSRKDEIEDFARGWDVTNVTTDLTKAEMKKSLYSRENADKIPLSYKNGANEIGIFANMQRFSEIISELYNPSDEIMSKLENRGGPILLLPIAGYVSDTGGPSFSRPDKGQVRLVYELFGRGSGFGQRVTILYSELIPSNWVEQVRQAQREDGAKLSGTNNLWRELVKFSDIILVDVCESEKDCQTGVIV